MVTKALLASSAVLTLSPVAGPDAEQALRDAFNETDLSDVDDRNGEQLILNYLRDLGLGWGDT
jgi:hypothetical protein